MPCREIKQDLNLKIQKVGPKAKRPKKNQKNNTTTHPMTMPQAAGKKRTLYSLLQLQMDSVEKSITLIMFITSTYNGSTVYSVCTHSFDM